MDIYFIASAVNFPLIVAKLLLLYTKLCPQPSFPKLTSTCTQTYLQCTVVVICANSLLVSEPCILPARCISLFLMITIINSDYFTKKH
jgi:hypothetical protein